MSIITTAEEEILVGHDIIIEGPAPEGPFLTVFEDDGETGYFYAVDTHAEGGSVQDAMQIYNVANSVDRTKSYILKIGWSSDSQKAVLLINDFPQAVFDFSSRRGFCRTGFPPPKSDGAWSREGHQWNDSVVELFR